MYTEFPIKDSLMYSGFFAVEYLNSNAMGKHFSEAYTSALCCNGIFKMYFQWNKILKTKTQF